MRCNILKVQEDWLLLDNDTSYAGMDEYVWNDTKWHVWIIVTAVL